MIYIIANQPLKLSANDPWWAGLEANRPDKPLCLNLRQRYAIGYTGHIVWQLPSGESHS